MADVQRTFDRLCPRLVPRAAAASRTSSDFAACRKGQGKDLWVSLVLCPAAESDIIELFFFFNDISISLSCGPIRQRTFASDGTSGGGCDCDCERLWIGLACAHVGVLHACVGVRATLSAGCQRSRWLRKLAGTTRGD